MDILTLITNYKTFLEKNYSKITVKNYISDVNHFTHWFARNQNASFSPDLLNKNIINEYKNANSNSGTNINGQQAISQNTLSFISLKRHLSSLRSFTAYLLQEKIITTNPFEADLDEKIPDLWAITAFKNYLYENSASKLTIKFYLNDMNAFIRWHADCVKNTTAPGELPTLNTDILEEYTKRLKETLLLSPKSINRKLSSIRRYLAFMSVHGQNREATLTEIVNVPVQIPGAVYLSEVVVPEQETPPSKIPPVRFVRSVFYPYLEFENKMANILSARIIKSRLKNTFQNQAKPQAQMIDKMIRGLSGKSIKKEFYAPYSVSTDAYPIHKKVVFHLRYTRPEWYKRYHSYPFVHYLHFGVLLVAATSAALFLYYETTGQANAEQEVISRTQNRTYVFKGKLFDQNHKPISEDTNLRLSLYNSPTASGSAMSWEEVQDGIKTDSDGNITIIVGSKNPIPDSLFQGNSPMYLGITVNNGEELSPREELGVPYAGNAGRVQGLLPITSSDRQTNVLLALNGNGNLSIGGNASPVFEATGGSFTLIGQTVILTTNASSDGNIAISPNGNGRIDLTRPLINSSGVVTAEGGLSITATTSASPALSINQDSGGPLISAVTAGASRFLVDGQGTITKGIWAGSPIGTEFGGFGASITPRSPGELLYSTSTSAYGHLAAGNVGQCLVSNKYNAPLWSSCGFLSQLNGAVSLTNNTFDILLGNTATSSAKFAFTNMSSGIPTFKIGGSLSITSDNLLQADNQDLKLGGSTTKNILLAQAGGNVGVGTTSPTRSLDINGTFGGNVDYYTDGATEQTITRTTKALIYDLEKDTGATGASTTTIYNIVGLPNIDGTIAFIYSKVSKGVTADARQQTITLKINGDTIATLQTKNQKPADAVIKHFTVARSNNSWRLIGDAGNYNQATSLDATDSADLAEWTPYNGTTPLPGALVSIDDNGNLTNSSSAYDRRVAGIVSTNPHTTIGQRASTSVRLALSGRVPAIITTLAGTIQAGDYITSSPLTGIGMRLNQAGATVGKALEGFTPNKSFCTEALSLEAISWPQDDGKNSPQPCFKIQVQSLNPETQDLVRKYGLANVDYIYISKVMVLTSLSWSNSDDLIASIDSAKITEAEPNTVDPGLLSQMETLQRTNPVVTVGGRTVASIQVFGGIIVGKLKAGAIIATTIAVNNLSATTATISDLTAISMKADLIVSPLAKVDTLKVNTITTNGEHNLTVGLPSTGSAVIVKNESLNKEVTRLDADGNASFSGQVFSSGLNTKDATVSGTLHANNVIADNISGLDAKVSSFAAQFALNTKPIPSAPSESFGSTFQTASVSAKFGTFYDGLLSLGASTFGNLSVMDQLSIGATLTISQNSINTLGADFNIQPLRQGAISFLAGAVRIEVNGQLTVNEHAIFNKTLTVKGKLYAGIVSPLPEKDLEVNLPSDSNLVIKDSSGSAALAINNRGDVSSSGSATFSKLNFNLVGQAIASGNFTATASGSAGTAVLKANTTELSIINPLATKDSLIYITPANNTNNTVLYLMRQTANTNDGPIGSFTVGVSEPVSQDILFNWLIVN